MNYFKSKTINFNYIMLAVGVLHGSLQVMQPLFTPEHFIYISVGLGMVQTLGSHYLRTITTMPLSEK